MRLEIDRQWFGEYNITSGESTPLKKRKIYKDDWIGLKTLDEKRGLAFLEAEGAHVNTLSPIFHVQMSNG